MRAVLLFVIGFVVAVQGYGQQPISTVKTQRTTFSISAVDDKTSAEIPAQFVIQAKQAHKTFEGKSQSDTQPYYFIMNPADTLSVIARSPGYYEA